MDALTLWPEWLPTFLHLGKRVENRTWSPPKRLIGQRLALHAGASVGGGRRAAGIGLLQGAALAAGYQVGHQHDRPENYHWLKVEVDGDGTHLLPIDPGLIIAHGRLAGAYHVDQPALHIPQDRTGWAFGPWCWLLEDLQVLDSPIPAKGRQGLWRWDGDLGPCHPVGEPLPLHHEVRERG